MHQEATDQRGPAGAATTSQRPPIGSVRAPVAEQGSLHEPNRIRCDKHYANSFLPYGRNTLKPADAAANCTHGCRSTVNRRTTIHEGLTAGTCGASLGFQLETRPTQHTAVRHTVQAAWRVTFTATRRLRPVLRVGIRFGGVATK